MTRISKREEMMSEEEVVLSLNMGQLLNRLRATVSLMPM